MAAVAVYHVRIKCDGCGVESSQEFDNATEARAAVYAGGWRFPNRLSARGDKQISQTSDVCPDCIETWTPQRGR